MNKVQERFIDTMKKHHWNNEQMNGKQGKVPGPDDVLRPFLELSDYVKSAKRSGLQRTEQCAYAGSILLDSLLEVTGRRFTYDVEEANDIFKAGRDLANELWGRSGTDVSNSSDLKEMKDLILNEYQRFRRRGGS
ncbi:MAG: hypothetical protein V3U09_08540 [Thermoplasmata archaeon]